jgi:hypothetical protein
MIYFGHRFKENATDELSVFYFYPTQVDGTHCPFILITDTHRVYISSLSVSLFLLKHHRGSRSREAEGSRYK